MPRPCKDDPRDWNFTLRLSIAERTRLQRAAASCGVSLAAYARKRLFQDAAVEVVGPGEVAEDPGTTPVTQLAVLLLGEQLRRAGVNLKPSARHQGEPRAFSDDAGEAAMPQTFLGDRQHRLLAAGIGIDHPVGMKPCHGEARREEIAATLDPENRAGIAAEKAGDDTARASAGWTAGA